MNTLRHVKNKPFAKWWARNILTGFKVAPFKFPVERK